MSDALNLTLALAKQAYEDLLRLTPLDALDQNDFGSGPKRERVAELLKKLNAAINAVQRTLGEHVAAAHEPPVITLPTAHREFYNEVLLPKGKFLQRAYLEISGLNMLVGLLDDPTDEKPEPLMLDAISWALERWNDALDEDEQCEWYERGFNIEGAQDLVAMQWFQPDDWSRNLRLLQPVLVDRSSQVMRDHVRYRLTEIYRAFAYGLWMAAIALSRSLVEFSLKANATRLGISITYQGPGGRLEDKSLKQIGEDVAAQVQGLSAAMDTVRETGNRILHPKKHDVIAHPKVMRAEALECVRAARLIVETLYSDTKLR
jgi:hypothetical protein